MNRWYKESIVYQIYPRSFQDSNDDGIGDLRGIINRLDYIRDLGVTAIWLSPVYDSPLFDNGYDIRDYRAILSEYGTMDEFKELLSKVHERGMKLIMDCVVNHTSDQHEWFQKAIQDPTSPYHDYYFFRKGKKKPNNWLSYFGGSVWTYLPQIDENYLHVFAPEQPDLNWENPKVREEIKDILRFWLDMGIDGFRCDVIDMLSKTPGLPNSHRLSLIRGSEYFVDGPHIHDYLQELKRDIASKYDMFTVGECVYITPVQALKYTQEGVDELNMVFSFEHMGVDNWYKWFLRKFRPVRLKKVLSKWQHAINGKGWNSLYFENHDQPRSVSRFGNLRFRNESAKMLAAMLFFQQGTPFIYQGEEIGMTNPDFEDISQYRDVETHNIYRLGRKLLHLSSQRMMKKIRYMSRDNARTPMQWNSQANGGFTRGKPWLEVNPNYQKINVEESQKDPNSILNYYKKLIDLRKTHPVIVFGDYQEHYPNHKKLVYYERNYQNDQLLVICNYSDQNLTFEPKHELKNYELILNNYPDDQLILLPYQAKVYLRRK
ncbi:MAG TPA: glucohydrolase [Acholeplasmatales bacterium]|nr:glucohydrolase [Acholeplasmatales bacterium]